VALHAVQHTRFDAIPRATLDKVGRGANDDEKMNAFEFAARTCGSKQQFEHC
jgi:hypothetical protein